MMHSVDVIIVAGGRGSRMGGIDKATVKVDGRRLIDIQLDALTSLPEINEIVVVSTRGLELRPGITLAQEDPPFAGPLAAVVAGVKSVRTPAQRTLLLSVDAPQAPDMLPLLQDALGDNDAAMVVSDGFREPLLALWDSDSLRSAIDGLETVENRPVKLLYEDISLIEVPGNGAERDYDTLKELAEYGTIDSPEG